ncbi:CD209 antigen-like protein A, partial [Anneissia japonica]|uniref:CD209 antigen-like protein A n=1 Tax=Anneissia japonica TaxID=1529436 RepID=UPI0014258D7B
MCTGAVFQNACYTIECNNNDFDDAVINCQSVNAALVSIHSLEEDNFVKQLVKDSNYNRVYIGLQRIDEALSTYYWNDNSSVDYMSNARDLETHHHQRCHIIDKSRGYDWEEDECSNEYCGMCKKQ